MKAQTLGAFVLLLLFATISQAEEWRGIVPLKSTRADVERLFGKPNHLGRYQFENERAYIYYSSSPCDDLTDCECLVAKDTVLHISVTLEVTMKFAELKIDLTKFEETRDTHLLTYVSYTNEEQGIIYTVAGGEVTEITYISRTDDCKELVRKKRHSKQP